MPLPPAKVPIYPRPVSPLRAEPVPIFEGEIVYESSSSGEDGKITERAAKRQRIEKWGERYLRGESIMILSAGLKGPFEGTSWKNPWAKKQQRQKSPPEVPETTKIQLPRHLEVAETGERTRGKSRRTDKAKYNTVRSDHEVRSLDGSYFRSANQSVCLKSTMKARRVEDWLRTNDAVGHPDEESQFSPTPSRNRTEHSVAPRPIVEAEITMASSKSSPKVHANNIILFLEEEGIRQAESDGETREELPQTHTKPQIQHVERPPGEEAAAASEEGASPGRNQIILPNVADSERAEFAILKTKRRSLHNVPASTDLSQFEYRKAAVDTIVGDSHSKDAIDALERTVPSRNVDLQLASFAQEIAVVEKVSSFDPTVSDQAKVQVPSTGKTNTNDKIQKPALSLQTTNSSTVLDLFPSAQIQAPIFEPSISVPSNGDLIPEPYPVSIRKEQESFQVGKESITPHQPVRPEKSSAEQRPHTVSSPVSHKQPGLAFIKQRKSSPIRTQQPSPVKNLDTQQMLASLTPLGFGTIKKIPLESVYNPAATPETATKVKSLNETSTRKAPAKRASFAGENFSISSNTTQGSIKMSLKVAKATRATDRPPKSSMGAGSPGVEIPLHRTGSNEDNASLVVSEKLHSFTALINSPTNTEKQAKSNPPAKAALKSALKTSSANGSVPISSANNPFTFPSSKLDFTGPGISTGLAQSHQPDGQNQAFRPTTELLDETFDLEGAIDDLGSYLGTWDADKKANGLIGDLTD